MQRWRKAEMRRVKKGEGLWGERGERGIENRVESGSEGEGEGEEAEGQ